MKNIIFLLSVLFSVTASAAGPFWIWYPEGAKSTAFRKTVTLDEEVKSATFYMACDTRALLYVNGKLPFANTQTPWLNLVILKTQRYVIPPNVFAKGDNVFAISAWPGENSAGFICKGEIVLQSGKTVIVDSDSSFLTFDREHLRVPGEEIWQSKNPKNWNSPGGDFSAWKPAKELGPADMEQYRDKLDTVPLLRQDHFSGDRTKQGRLMLDDFSDISSWLGGPVRGHNPAATRPVYFSMGSVAAAERDDNFCGEIRYSFRDKNGIAQFSKNAVYQTWAKPSEIIFSADAAGKEYAISFEFEDKAGKRFKTREVILDGQGWRNYHLPFDSSGVSEFNTVCFPVAMRSLLFRAMEPGAGDVRIDDLAYLADVSNPRKQISIHPEYRQLAFAPGETLQLNFLVRNALLENVECDFLLRIISPDGKVEREQKAHAGLAAESVQKISFESQGFSRLGPYRIELTADNGKTQHTFQGWVGVFVPNDRRVNKQPMWFGIEDQEFHTAPYEVRLHAQWMKLLGVDLLRGIFMGTAAQYERGTTMGLDAFSQLWQPHFDIGLDLLLDYAADVPPWTFSDNKKKTDPNWFRNQMSDQPGMLAEHISDVANFMAKHPQIKYFEWLNEPDLNGFKGTADEYIASLKLIYPIIKKNAPGVKVTTGGMVVTHPYGKPDFTRRVYEECADFYDVAAFHCHDDINAYKRYHTAITEYMKLAKISKPIGNTEAGSRSYQSAPSLFFTQAAVLVKKITYAKSRNSEFYIWFMLQDYWDKYVNADDTFGLITVDNQPKPSFLAYNELIRQLANTTPAEDATALDTRLETYRFHRGNDEVFVCWPVKPEQFLFAVKSEVPVTQIDIYGNRQDIAPQNGFVLLAASDQPFYLVAPNGKLSPGSQPVVPDAVNVGVPGETVSLKLLLTNTTSAENEFTLTCGDNKVSRHLVPEQSETLLLPVKIAPDAVPGSTAVFAAELNVGNINQPVILTAAVAVPVPGKIILNSADKLTELAFDPATPRWSGPQDLSAEIFFRSDSSNLYLDITVCDQEHNTPFDGVDIWKNDSIQLAFAPPEGNPSELTISGTKTGQAIVWRHIFPDKTKIGKLEIPAEISRLQGETRYKITIPFKEIGLDEKNTVFRMSVLVNDNDGNKRLRLMEWCRGIENDKSPELFGWAKIVR